jgi:hypothetical protein
MKPTGMTTTYQILKILRSNPFSRFSMSQLEHHLSPALSDQDIHSAMVELFQGGEPEIVADGVHDMKDGSVEVRWVSYYGD